MGTDSSAACGSLSPQVPASLALGHDADVSDVSDCSCDNDNDDVEGTRLMTSRCDESLVSDAPTSDQLLLPYQQHEARDVTCQPVPRLNQYSDDEND